MKFNLLVAGIVVASLATAVPGHARTGSGSISLVDWELTLPIGKPGNPTVISTAELPSYSSIYFEATSEGVTFWAPVDGVATSNSGFPRSEFRETNRDGSLFNWLYSDYAESTLSAVVTVEQVPSTGKVVIGQIHDNDKSDDQPLIKLQYSPGGTVEALVRKNPHDSNSKATVFATGIPLGVPFSYEISLTGEGELSATLNGETKVLQTLNKKWKSEGLYFKAGSYVQDNEGPDTEGAKVYFSSLAIKH